MRAYASEMLVGSIHVREFDTAILCSQIWSSAVSVHIKAIIGAEEGTRTPTPLRVHGPEPCASANSATSASDWRNLLRIASGKNYTSYSTEAAEAVNGERPTIPSSGGYKLRHRRSASQHQSPSRCLVCCGRSKL